ncbi:ribonuclease P protein subunit p21 isoform X2 [Agelaius tricolor]|uniref:ribonuclease P protein subunit p21 isoform X2 n=1 Tax=Agelaius tricolor TaxID=9191 RepID=UPI0039F210D9
MAAPVKDREALQRLNFLFQAAHWSLPVSPALSRFLLRTQRAAAQRLVLRMAPSIKRRLCRRCLLPAGAGGREPGPAPRPRPRALIGRRRARPIQSALQK